MTTSVRFCLLYDQFNLGEDNSSKENIAYLSWMCLQGRVLLNMWSYFIL